MRLPPEVEACGYRLLVLDTTDSTNEDAARAAREGDPGRLWIVAREQRAGRGRHGRSWSSPAGNLYASLLLIDPCEAPFAPQLGFLAGLALHEAVAKVSGIGAPRLSLKWPNDLLLDGAKLSGLLLEAHRVGAAFAFVVGFGVNIASSPTGTPYPATALRAVCPDVSAERLFPELARSFSGIHSAWQTARAGGASDPFLPIRRCWLECASGIGTEVTVRLPSGERRGVFTGLDRSGRLELRTSAGLELIDAGDLYFPQFKAELSASATRS